MRIQVLVQGEQWLDRAGVRIRYRRIGTHLARLGGRLTVDVIGQVAEAGFNDADVVVLSKCTDARGLAMAEMLRSQGVIVGVDLFDDYFSPRTSPCYIHRDFLRQMLRRVDFILCSTPRMSAVGREFAPEMPVHVLNDPLDALDADVLSQRLETKAQFALATASFNILWFGNGDNPLFPVGLTDLAAFGSALRPFARSGFDVTLNVLTNARALGVENLARLRNLPLRVFVDEWSEEGERQALDEALVSFLPVNYQNFSVAKSLNRGISALTGGTQILSSGFPLYASLDRFVYRGAEDLLRDLGSGALRLRADTMDDLAPIMDALADPANEAARFFGFLDDLLARRPRLASFDAAPAGPQAVLHGRRSPAAVQKFCRARGWLSIASPVTNALHKFDVVIGFADGSSAPRILLSPDAASTLAPSLRDTLQQRVAPGHSGLTLELPLPHSAAGAQLAGFLPAMVASRAGRMIHYVQIMEATEAVCAEIFPGVRILRSEQESPLMGLDGDAWPACTQVPA